MSRALAAVVLVAAHLLVGCGGQTLTSETSTDSTLGPRPYQVSDGRFLMGTVLDVTLVGDDPEALQVHLEWVFERVAQIEVVASRHRADSELSRFNAAAGRAPSAAYSRDLVQLLERSVEAGIATDGAFDVTVGPLITFWLEAVRVNEWPTGSALDAARARVGFDSIIVTDAGEVGLAHDGRSVDFGGIGKGWALDVVRAGLVERGVTQALLDFGGSSVWAMGHAPDGGAWRFGVDARDEGGAARVIALVDQALSVSSSLGESSLIGGEIVGHVIDPATGETIDEGRTAVAVGASATEAEVWTTALLVMPRSKGIERVDERGRVEAWVAFEDAETRSTAGFAPLWDDLGAAAR